MIFKACQGYPGQTLEDLLFKIQIYHGLSQKAHTLQWFLLTAMLITINVGNFFLLEVSNLETYY